MAEIEIHEGGDEFEVDEEGDRKPLIVSFTGLMCFRSVCCML